jgi:hypothetical protein
MQHKFDIAILLPTRGRSDSLERSVKSLIELVSNVDKVQLMLGFDNDDPVGMNHFMQVLKPWLDQRNVNYIAVKFSPMGYTRLNEYLNELARKSDAKWLVFWNDDAVMQTQDWNTKISEYDGQFKLLAFHTHNDHPYSIFPIVPHKWVDILGYFSPHPTTDAWLSQQAYMLDIWQRIEVDVLHDRYDLTGNNNDDTFKNRRMLEGNPTDPLDFHSVPQMTLRHNDCVKIATYLKNDLGQDMTFFENVFANKQDPWEKLAKNDVNRQMVQFDSPHKHFKPPAQG